MKNVLNYYYNITPEYIHQNDKGVKFTYNGHEYRLIELIDYEVNVDNIYDLSLKLFQRNIYCHQFLRNKFNNLITNVNDSRYVLLLVYITDESKITLSDILNFTRMTTGILTNNDAVDWFNLWCDKIDYYEYQISQFGKKYPLIRESFNYFIGLGETAILFFKNIYNKGNVKNTICHYRIKSDYTLYDLYNPLNFRLDYINRDVAEYFKDCFFRCDYDIWDEMVNYIDDLTGKDELSMFFSRMMFPTFYFDVYEDIIVDKKEEKVIVPVISKIKEYEDILIRLYIYILNNKNVNIPEIEWFNRY